MDQAPFQLRLGSLQAALDGRPRAPAERGNGTNLLALRETQDPRNAQARRQIVERSIDVHERRAILFVQAFVGDPLVVVRGIEPEHTKQAATSEPARGLS